jgi:DNA-binding NarL/FixJ family response regulator
MFSNLANGSRLDKQKAGEPATGTCVAGLTTPTALIVIDDHPIVHTGVRRWVAEAAIPTNTVSAHRSVSEFLHQNQAQPKTPAVIVYDPEHGERKPDYVGLQQLCQLKNRVIAYSRIAAPEIILNCLDVGASSYVAKAESPQHLTNAIVAALRGSSYHGPSATAAIRVAKLHGRPELTAQERRVLIAWLLNENKESVGKTLHIAPSTVRTHLQRIRRRYREINRPAPSKAALFARAVQDGLLGIHDV